MDLKKPIIKKNFTYNRLKLAKGLDISLYNSIKKEEVSGISTIMFGDKWFLLPKGKAIFKTFDYGILNNVRNNRIYNELLCYKLANQIGLACAKYEIAYKQDDKFHNGLVSYNVLNENEELVSGHEIVVDYIRHVKKDRTSQYYEGDENNIQLYLDIFDSKKYQNCIINKQEILETLFKIAVFDLITFQTDRHNENIHFIYNKIGKSYKIAPLIDNELSFAVDILSEYIGDDYTLRDVPFDKIMFKCNHFAKFLTVRQIDGIFNTYILTIKDLVRIASKNKNLMSILKNELKNININKAITELNNEGCKVDKGYEDYLKYLISFSKNYFKEEINRLSKSNEENDQKGEDEFEASF